MGQVRAFLAAAERAKRDEVAGQFALMVTAARGDNAGIKALAGQLTR